MQNWRALGIEVGFPDGNWGSKDQLFGWDVGPSGVASQHWQHAQRNAARHRQVPQMKFLELVS